MLVALLIGMAAGYFGGKTDLIIQRFVDAWMWFGDALRDLLDPRLRGGSGRFSVTKAQKAMKQAVEAP